MKILNWFLFLNLILAADQLQTCAKADEQAAGKSVTVTVERLRCEYQSDPLSIATPKPRLSWIIQSERRGERQTAYRVLVASTPEILAKDQGDLWDSGKVASDQ